jgi:hypothetical protein
MTEMTEKRFCPKGHDKLAPHGSYLSKDRGYVFEKCAQCKREIHNQRLTQKRRAMRTEISQ